MTQIFDEKEILKKCTCLDCGWDGVEAELMADYYDEHTCSMVIAGNCPVCGGENID